MGRDEEFGGKKEWREADRGRDRSRHTRNDGPDRGKKSRGGGATRADADKLFASGKLAELYEARFGVDDSDEGVRLKKLRMVRAASDDDFAKEMLEYHAVYGISEDLEVLVRAVTVEDLTIVREALEVLVAQAEDGAAVPKPAVLKQRLGTLEAMYDDPDLLAQVATLRRLL